MRLANINLLEISSYIYILFYIDQQPWMAMETTQVTVSPSMHMCPYSGIVGNYKEIKTDLNHIMTIEVTEV